MKSEGYDLSFLYTGIPLHFGKAGWALIPEHWLYLTLPKSLDSVTEGFSIGSFDLERDLQGVRSVYEAFNASRTGTFDRSSAYWQNQPGWRGYEPELFLVAREHDRIVAYLKARRWALREFGYLPDAESAMVALVHQFLSQAVSNGESNVMTPAPLETLGLFQALGCSTERRQVNSSMMQVLSFRSLLEKAAPVFRTRLLASGYSAIETSLRIRYEADEATLGFHRGEISVLPSDAKSQMALVVSQGQLLKLLFGYIRAEDISFSNRLHLDDDGVGLVNALFTPGEFFMWEAEYKGF